MRTIKIRDLRGPLLEELSRSEQMVGITNHRVLAAVMVPVGQGWVEHLIESNWSRILQNVAEGEYERVNSDPLVGLDEALGATEPAGAEGYTSTQTRLDLDGPLAFMRRVTNALGHRGSQESSSEPQVVRTVRVGDLSGQCLQEAGEAGEIVAVTNDRRLTAFLIPVTEQLVAHLIENNLTRVMFNVAKGENERMRGEPLTTLNQALLTGSEGKGNALAPQNPAGHGAGPYRLNAEGEARSTG